MDPRSAYVHIPFCHRRCFYCDFPVVPLGDRADGATSGSVAAYLDLLHQEIAASPGGPPLATVYLGGGTPSMLSSAQVAGILEALDRRFGLAPGAELSLELDPASFDQARLAGYLAAGITRVSLGGQSFDDGVLADLGRRHRGADLREAAGWLGLAHRRGDLASWSLDLIQGLPSQNVAHWDGQLSAALALEPPHLSVYDLSIEPGTVFERRLAQGELALPPEDLAADLMDLTWARLTAAGYGHYEVSNYALPGHASRHNRVYWSGAGWWGFGMGATAAPRGRRRAHPRTRAGYAEALAARTEEPADDGEGMPFDERLMVGLRCREGVNLERLARQESLKPSQLERLRQRLAPYEQRGLLRVEGPRWRLSDPQGLALSKGVLRELLAWWQEQEPPPASAP
ncbi:radical SAM family heme chaperone HemW [Cyanobium sp. N5-Cardenillas]|uniref:radical SAM family heme chaperone HemW n=1 Tax=Cyanobium sp. N5-Cardenillas TaxID=2823720 RepID=UPI0020CD82FA|nr:radical SAM family heme chaperone HemW [Cyanobium sp. N5-Cardenillas]MCP9786382.1 radical SAM family heme chaperone HemW [Cyanobium sp. N5-Cardenillas]